MPLQSLLDLPDRSSCTCSCFDNRFKQGNPSLGLYKAYKSFYFNFDERIWSIVVWCVVCFVISSAAVQTIYAQFFSGKRCALWAVGLVVLSIYPLFYTWWAVVNYLNEGSSRMIGTQFFYGLTDTLGVLAVALSHLDAKRQPHTLSLWITVSVSTTHILSNLSFFGANASPRFGLLLMWISDVLTLAIVLFKLCQILVKQEEMFRVETLWTNTIEALEFLGGDESIEEEEEEVEKDENKNKRGKLKLQRVYSKEAFLFDALYCGLSIAVGVLYIRSACLWNSKEC